MNSNFTISETQKLPIVLGNHDFLKGIHESLKKTTLALCVLLLFAFQQGLAQFVTPTMPESDRNIVQRPDGGGGMIKGANGTWYVWGLGAYFDAHPDKQKYWVGTGNYPGSQTEPLAGKEDLGYAEVLEPLTPANGFPYTGNILRVAITASGFGLGSYNQIPTGSANRVLLTDDNKLWLIPFGDIGGGTNMGITVNAAANVNTVREAKLPVGVTAAQVTFMDGTTTGTASNHFLYLVANGNIYIAGSFEGQQGSETPVKDANGWQKVMINATTPLSDITWVAEQNGSTMAALTSDNKVYIFGNGFDSPQTCTNENCKLLLPVGVAWRPNFANLAKTHPVALANVYPANYGSSLTGKGTDGKIYRLGEVDYGGKLSGPILSTFPTNGKTLPNGVVVYPYCISTNPRRWQYAEMEEKRTTAAQWLGYNSTWKPEYFLDGEELSNIKFFKQTPNGGIALRDHEDYKYLYHVGSSTNNSNSNGHSIAGNMSGSSSTNYMITGTFTNSWTMIAGGDRRLAYMTPVFTFGGGPDDQMFTMWGLSHDGKVCAYNLHPAGPFRDWDLINMGMYDLKTNRWNSYDNNTWRCGTPKTADGYVFAAAGAVSSSTGSVGAGTIDCAKTQLSPAPVSGTPSQLSLIVTVNVTTAGSFPLTVTGSGFTLANGITSATATTTGVQQFVIPINYDGTALGSLTFTVGSAGSCSANLSTIASRPVNKLVLTLDNCAAITPGTISK